jgi:alpha-L-fucosidase
MQANPFLGVSLHSVGALSAASCYTPQKKTKQWAWEIYWVTQATFGWVILPFIGAMLTIPNYFEVLQATPNDAMLRSFVLGVIYGIGGLSFGLGIRYIGFSLNYTIAIGISAGLGTLMPLIWDPNKGFVWEIAEKFSTTPGLIVLAGIILSLIGIIFCGWAGALRERAGSTSSVTFSFKKGVPLAVLAGTFSAVYNFALLAGAPLEQAAIKNGASELLKLNAVLPFACGGAWVTSVIWCIILIFRNRTGSQLVSLPAGGQGSLPFYYLMALLSGMMWYFQFFFYGIGHTHMGQKYGFTSWAIHMALLILFSNLYGKIFKEWVGASKLPRRILHLGMLIIIIATLIISYGNYLGEKTQTDLEVVTSTGTAFTVAGQVTYKPEWESLQKHPVPEWFRDAKFGIYSHLGPYTVPAFQSEWYSCLMYKPDQKPYKYHQETYGDQSTFGYKDFIPMLTLENFDADAIAELFQNSGARFVGLTAEHADGFAMWDSKLTVWDAADMGPKRDIIGLMEKAVKKRGMKFVTTFHHDWNWDWYPVWDERYDCSDPNYAGLYGQPHKKGEKPTEEFFDEWEAKVIEVIDKYKPDLVYFDSKLDTISEKHRQETLSYYYNKEKEWGKQVSVTYKIKQLPVGAGILDMERIRMSTASKDPWLNDDPIDWKSWCHIQNPSYKSVNHIIDGLVDVVSKNGTFMLNVGPTAKGEIPEPVVERLTDIGQWLKINGEAIYGTRPWTTSGEGPTVVEGKRENESGTYTAEDIRFTSKGDTLYAIALDWPQSGRLTIKTLNSKNPALKKIRSIELLGHQGRLEWSQDENALTIQLPEAKPCENAFVFKILPE